MVNAKDLQSLLVFVPPLHHAFYNSIKAEPSRDTDDTVDTEDTEYEDGSTETRDKWKNLTRKYR